MNGFEKENSRLLAGWSKAEIQQRILLLLIISHCKKKE